MVEAGIANSTVRDPLAPTPSNKKDTIGPRTAGYTHAKNLPHAYKFFKNEPGMIDVLNRRQASGDSIGFGVGA